MSLFVFDKEQTLIKLIPNKNIISLVHEEVINKPDILSGEMKLSEWDSIQDKPHYAAVRAEDGFNLHFFKVTNVTENINTIGIKGVSLAHDELQAYGYIKDRRFVDANPHNVLSAILDGTDWSIGRFNIPPQTVTINFYYVSRLEALNLLIEKLNAEVTFRIRFSGNSIQGKVINVLKEISEFKGKRFALGTNLIDVVGEEDTSTIYTALIGRGKGEASVDEEGNETGGYGRRITFENLEWKKEYGDPLDKPLGQPYLENPQATELYGYADGTPRMGIVEFPDLEYPENVLRATYNQLLQTSRPKKQFKAVVDKVGDMELGETVAIIKPGTDFRYMTRVFKVKRDHLDNSYTEVEFGDRLVKTLGETLKLAKEDVKDDIADDILDSSSDINQAIDSAVRDSIDGAIGEGGYPRDIVADSLKIEGEYGSADTSLKLEGYREFSTLKFENDHSERHAIRTVTDLGDGRINIYSHIDRIYPYSPNDSLDGPYLSIDHIPTDHHDNRFQSIALKHGSGYSLGDEGKSQGSIILEPNRVRMSDLRVENLSFSELSGQLSDDDIMVFHRVSMGYHEIEGTHNPISGIRFKFAVSNSGSYVYYLVTVSNGIFRGDVEYVNDEEEITWTKVLE